MTVTELNMAANYKKEEIVIMKTFETLKLDDMTIAYVLKLIDEKTKEYETQKPLVRSLWKREALKELKEELLE